MKLTVFLLVLAINIRPFAADTVIWQEAESLTNTGGWSNDSQHVDIMGSPYLLATGVGRPVADAIGTVSVPQSGRYTLWVRCRDWHPAHSPGQFKVYVGGRSSGTTFGKAENDDWRWVYGGAFALYPGDIELRLKDTTGWWGRVDALVLSTGSFRPADDLKSLNQQRETHNGVSPDYRSMGRFDVVVVGGGSSGLGAALGAARNGAKVAFIQDRPVLGGNGSDEIMVPPMGYIGRPPDHVNVTGIAEEIFPLQGWTSFGSSTHYEQIVRAETNISLHLNTRATGVEMRDEKTLQSVLALDVHRGQRMRFTAPLFIDTTGHGWIGYYAGADYRAGTEARSEFDEAMAPISANSHTMGNSLYKAEFKKMNEPVRFDTPPWAYQWKSPDDFEPVLGRTRFPVRPEKYDQATRGPGRPISVSGIKMGGAFTWYVETGGMSDTIWDAEHIRDELFRIHMGLWGYTKNHAPNAKETANIAMVWLNYVPGVRESRRLTGDYIMTQKDFDDRILHADTVAFTDWGIDDHHPHGFFTRGIDVMHVYGGRRISIPYRSLYSRNIDNLFMAGRCLSASHLALGGVRVQRPMAATGQAAGTAAAIAKREKCLPRDIYAHHLGELQQRLLKDGCYLIGIRNQDPADLALRAHTQHSALIDGWNREIKGKSEAVPWSAQPITLTLAEPATVGSVHLTLHNRYHKAAFAVEILNDGEWSTVATTRGGRKQRRYVLNFDSQPAEKVRFRLRRSSGPVAITEIRLYKEHCRTTEIPGLKEDTSGLRNPPRPIKLEGILVDESDAILTGTWIPGIYDPIYGQAYLHDGNTDKGAKSAAFKLTVPKNAKYEIKILYTTHENRSGNTPVILKLNGKDHNFRINQKVSDGAGHVLGRFTIEKDAELLVSNKGANGYVIIDGVQLKEVR